jgi:hypothetical protein
MNVEYTYISPTLLVPISSILHIIPVKPLPHPIKELLSPTRNQARRFSLFAFEMNQLLLYGSRTLAAFEQVRVNVLTRAIRRKTLGGQWKILSKSSMSRAVTALESRKADGTLGSRHKAVSFGESAQLHLPHEKVDVLGNKGLLVWKRNEPSLYPGVIVDFAWSRRRRRLVVKYPAVWDRGRTLEPDAVVSVCHAQGAGGIGPILPSRWNPDRGIAKFHKAGLDLLGHFLTCRLMHSLPTFD